uniref:Polyamine transporter PUT1 n=1 Tax=Oryza meridionalis TaxID=40149 RepID=A0A0E0D1E1_9ORYZ
MAADLADATASPKAPSKNAAAVDGVAMAAPPPPPPPGGGGHGRAPGNKLSLVPLIFLIFFEVAGGPYGAEPAVQSAGPLFALLGFLVFPFIWAVPESLVTAELSTAMPGNGGFVLWADRAFGPFAGSLMGTWKYVSGAINGAAFPALCADYVARVAPAVSGGGARVAAIVAFNVAISVLNYTGLSIVGWTAVALGIASLSPFALMFGAALPKIRPRRWRATAADRDWKLFFNTLFWNLNYWDSASTMAGEVERPGRTFPRALLSAVAMTTLGYLLPLLAATGAIDAAPEDWGNGFFADAAGMIAGGWLKYWIEVGAVLSTIGLYSATLSSAAFQLLGMADLGLLPRAFALRAPVFDTPWVGILATAAITLAMSFTSFDTIVASANFLYSLGMLLEFAAFVRLRARLPAMPRPYAVPLRGLPAAAALCAVPSAFLVFVMAIAGWKVYAISAVFTAAGVAVYYLMDLCKARGWLTFSAAAVRGGGDAMMYRRQGSTASEVV